METRTVKLRELSKYPGTYEIITKNEGGDEPVVLGKIQRGKGEKVFNRLVKEKKLTSTEAAALTKKDEENQEDWEEGDPDDDDNWKV